MKKSVAIILIACAILSLFIVSCVNNPVCYTVTVKDGEKTIDTQIVNEGAEYTLPAAPNTRGHVFSGWQSSGGGSNLKAGAKVKVSSDLTFTAVWGDAIATPDISAINTTNVYKATEKITLTELAEGTTYRWTLDGSEPTATTTNTGKEIALSGTAGTVTVKIVVEKEGSLSETATLTLKVEPTITFESDYSSSPLSTTDFVKLNVPANTTVYYTTNGDEPTTNSPVYNATTGISLADLTGSTTIKVLAIKDEVEAKDQITIKVQLPGPTVNANTTTTYTQTDKIEIAVPTGAEVRYTIDGSEPTATTGTVYDATTGISLSGNSGNITIKAATYKNGEACSAVSTITIKVQPITPTYLPEETAYAATAEISGSTNYDAYTKIYYTTDGTTPTTSSAEATDGKIPLTGLSGKVTIKVIAVKDDIASQVTDFEVKVTPTISFGDTADGADVGQDEKLTISASAGASVYYTTDGTDPKTSATKIEGKEIDFATVGAGSKTIKVYVVKDEVEATKELTVIVKPASPATGADSDEEGKLYTQTDTIAVTVSSTATCYYTLDDSDPTDTTNANRKIYDATSKIALIGQSGEVTIRAIVVDGGQTSKEKKLTVKVQPTVTLDKTANVELEATEAIAVAVLDTANTKIYYTVDGTEPVVDTTGSPTGTTATSNGTIPLTNLAGNVTVKVFAIKDNIKSNVTTLAIKVKPAVSFDTAAEAELEQTGSITITVPNGSTVYYTTDGTDPTTATTTTGTNISLTGLVGKVNIKVLAVKDGVTSAVKELLVKVKPTISFGCNANADVRQDQVVTFTVSDGVNVYYTTDGTEPTITSTKATDGKLDLSSVSTGSKTIKILAEKDGVTATAQLAINVKLALPVVSANETTTYTQSDSITITIPSETDIYYTLDGTDPADASNTSRKKYSTAVSLDGLSGEVVLRVVVVKGSEISEEKSLTLKIQPKKPTYTGATKNAYATSETLVFDAPSDAELYYTFDGSDPATSSTRIKATDGKSIPLAASLNGAETGNITVKVVSIKDNVVSEETTLNLYVSSKVVTLTYVLDGGTITATSYETNAPKGSNTPITLLTASQVSKSGYTFDGWYTDATPSTSNYAGTSVTLNNDNVTLYAHWVDDLEYTVSENSVSVGPGNATGDIVIPSIYQGKTVTKLNSFMMNTDITSVYIPSTVTTITDFSMDSKLKTVTIEGKALTSIPNEAFEGCDALETIIFKVNKSTVTLDCSAASIKNWMGTSTTTPTIIYGDTHTVTVYNTDGSVLVETYYVDADVTVSKPTVEPTGIASDKIFKYWTADRTTEFVFGKTITEDIELRPYVKVRERLTLTYELNGGNTSESCTVSIMEGVDSSEITLLTPTKSGYDFDGWYTKNPEDATVTATELATSYISTSTLNLAKNTTLYAHWVSDELTFKTNSGSTSVEGSSSITGDFVIPSVYQGMIVTEIAAEAFAGAKITSITIPDTVTTIGMGAFYLCSSLSEIMLPSSVTTFGAAAFSGCSSLTSINIPSGMTTVPAYTQVSEGFPYAAFYGCSKLETITFDDASKITSIADKAFAYCTGLKLISFNSNLADVTFTHEDEDIDKWTGSMSPRPTVVFKDSHKITYLNEDGTVFSTQYVSSTTTKISETPVITAEGKIFAYWSIDGTTEYVFGQTISEDIVLKPAVKDGIALTYVLNGGKITASSYDTQADASTPITVLTASDVSRDGYTFDGWYTKNPEDTKVSAADVVASYYSDSTVTLTKSVILYANWVTDKLTYTETEGSYSVKAKDLSITGELVIPRVYKGKLVTAIEQTAFTAGGDGCAQITSVVIPDSVETIGWGAFYFVPLKKVEFTGESKIKEISQMAFAHCEFLTEINIPQSVETIGKEAFEGCESLTVDILEGTKVTTIGECAFSSSEITTITIPNTVTSIGERAFYCCSDLETVIFAKSKEGKTAQITAIADETFSDCYALTTIEIPASVISIGDKVFFNDSNLASFTFEEGSVIESIGSYIFSHSGESTKITALSIPGTIKSISSSAFDKCSYLTSIYVDRDEPVEGDTDYATLVGTMTWSSSATITWKDSVAVTIDYNNGSASTVKNIKKGTSITKPSDPTYTGYDFVTWTTEDGEEYDFSSTITETTTIVAKWATAYEVGDVGPAGGYIIYVNPNYDATSTSNNWKYLEVSEEDLTKDGATTFVFGDLNTTIGGKATELAIGVGDSNTKAIVDTLGTSGNYAAFVCSNYSVEKDGKTYTGWYLPNSGELSLVYSLKTNFTSLDTTWTNGRYWSSTEDNVSASTKAAVFVDFSTGTKTYENNDKDDAYAVRAIRKVKVGE